MSNFLLFQTILYTTANISVMLQYVYITYLDSLYSYTFALFLTAQKSSADQTRMNKCFKYARVFSPTKGVAVIPTNSL